MYGMNDFNKMVKKKKQQRTSFIQSCSSVDYKTFFQVVTLEVSLHVSLSRIHTLRKHFLLRLLYLWYFRSLTKCLTSEWDIQF